jgi:U3 small nucleolar RNA-associated protein 22
MAQDGRICETVAWEVGPSQRYTIPDLIVGHVVGRHMPGASCQGFASTLDWALQTVKATPDDLINARR